MPSARDADIVALDAEMASDIATPLSAEDAAGTSLDLGDDDEELLNDFEEEVRRPESETMYGQRITFWHKRQHAR